MKIVLFLNFLISLGISLFLIVNFIKKLKDPTYKKSFNLFFIISLIYLVFSLFSFLWSFEIFKYQLNDFYSIYSIMILLQTILLFNLIYVFRYNKRIFYFFFCYLIIFSSGLVGISIPHIILLCSFLITLLLFILMISVPHFERISILGILYSSISLIIQIISLFSEDFLQIGSFISNILFLFFIFYFIKRTKIFPIDFFEERIIRRKRNYFIDFLRYFVFIIILTNFIFIGTITIHEVGHLLTSRAYDCGFDRIVYEQGLPHTEILCGEDFNALSKVILGGMLLPLVIAILLFFAGGTFIKEVSLLIVGFNFMISYKDILDLGFTKNISLFFSIIGAIFVLVAIGLLAKSRTMEDEFIYLG